MLVMNLLHGKYARRNTTLITCQRKTYFMYDRQHGLLIIAKQRIILHSWQSLIYSCTSAWISTIKKSQKNLPPPEIWYINEFLPLEWFVNRISCRASFKLLLYVMKVSSVKNIFVILVHCLNFSHSDPRPKQGENCIDKVYGHVLALKSRIAVHF